MESVTALINTYMPGSESAYFWHRLETIEDKYNKNYSLKAKIGMYRELVEEIIPHLGRDVSRARELESRFGEHLKPLLEERICTYFEGKTVPEAIDIFCEFSKKYRK